MALKIVDDINFIHPQRCRIESIDVIEWRVAMSNRLRLFSILASTILHQVAVIGTRPIVSLYASELGASSAMIGSLSSIYGLTALLCAVPAGRWIDRQGGQTVTKFGMALQVVGYLLIALGASVPAILVGQGISGVSFVLVVLGIQATIADEGNPEDHARNFATFTTVVSLAHLIGPISFGYVADHGGFRLAFLGATAATLTTLVLTLLFFPADMQRNRRKKAAEHPPGALLKQSLDLMKDGILAGVIITGALVQFAQDAMVTFFPLYAKELGLSATATGAILSARAISLLVVRPLLPLIITRWSRAQVLGHALFWGGMSTILMGVLTTFNPLVIAVIVAGATIGIAQPLTMAAVAEFAPPHARGLALSLRMSGNRLGQTISPLVLGIFSGPIGPAAALWISGGVLASGSLVVWRRFRSLVHAPTHAADD